MSTLSETAKSPCEKGRLHPDRIETEILANERTFLAWVRTSIVVMSLGFIIARFSLWMREMVFGNESSNALESYGHLCSLR
jgi:uncharacterized membrane protein YidH (DUF202 family)